jgi:hypothetical protein
MQPNDIDTQPYQFGRIVLIPKLLNIGKNSLLYVHLVALIMQIIDQKFTSNTSIIYVKD